MRNLINGTSLAVMLALGTGAAQAQNDMSGQSGSRANGTAGATQSQPSTSPSSATGAAPGSPADRSGAINEKQALGVLAAINTTEINAGNLALQKQVTGAVRDYASQMVKEHSDNNAKIVPWAPDAKAGPAERQLQKGQAEAKTLQALQGGAFARAYIDAMVKDHKAALKMLDDSLIPAAKTPQVAEHLRTTRTHVAAHLAKAQQLQQSGATASGADAR